MRNFMHTVFDIGIDNNTSLVNVFNFTMDDRFYWLGVVPIECQQHEIKYAALAPPIIKNLLMCQKRQKSLILLVMDVVGTFNIN